MRRGLLGLALAVLVAACSTDSYPLPPGPPHAGQRIPVAVGSPVQAVLIFIEVRPGDRIEWLAAAPIGSLDGASVRFLLSRQVIEADGTRVIGRDFEDLDGSVVTAASESPGPENAVGIAAELTANRPGRYKITDVRVRYRINGGRERVGQGIDVPWTVCADDPAPARCPEA